MRGLGEFLPGFFGLALAKQSEAEEEVGGGGFGPPAKRDAGLVREDVIDGYISPEAAQRDYGVVFKEGSREVDQEATEALRKSMNQSDPIP